MMGGRDPENRAPFPWDESRWDHDLRNRIKTFAHIRREHQVLRTGEYVPIFAEDRRLLVLRHLEGVRMLIAFNADGGDWGLDIPISEHFEDGLAFEDLLGGEGAVVEEGHLRKGRLRAWEGAIFQPQR
jgi:alpha-glucosidase